MHTIRTLLFEAGMRVCKNAADVSPGISSASRMADPANRPQMDVGVLCPCNAATAAREPCFNAGWPLDGLAERLASSQWCGVTQRKLWGRKILLSNDESVGPAGNV
jgi:hypothetical protein